MSESIERVKNKYIEMWIEDGIFYAKYADGVVIDLYVAKEILEERLKLIKGKSYPCFVDGRKVKYWTKEARVFQSSKENNIGMKAAAMYINSHALKVVIKFYLLFNKPNVPQDCFTDKKEALEWLKKFK